MLRSLSFAHNDAFTLAEVLITLVIIGVIAAITVPTLIVKYQKEQTVTRLKKAYSTLSQTTHRAITDNGPITTWTMKSSSAINTIEFLNSYLIPYLNVAKKPESFSDGKLLNKQFDLNGTEWSYNNAYARFYLSDGTSVTAAITQSDASTNRMDIYIDINGDKKPNKLGKDIFKYLYMTKSDNAIYNGKFTPQGIAQTREELLSERSWSCNKHNEGSRCAALIMKDGWQIKDDYPW